MKRGEVNPIIGVTDSALRSQIRSALRKVWRNSSRRVFIESVRFPYKGKNGRGRFGVQCAKCKRIMGQSEKEYAKLKNGNLSKKKKLAYEVDHINGNPPFTSMEELGAYAQSLLYGEQQILCRDCHAGKEG